MSVVNYAKTINSVYKTKSVDSFIYIDGNRPLKPHFKKIKESIRKYGQQEPILVQKITGGYFEILNGQHRHKAISELLKEGWKGGLDYIITDKPTKDIKYKLATIQSTNTTGKNWSFSDIIESRCKYSNNPDSYIFLNNLINFGDSKLDNISTTIALRLVSSQAFGEMQYGGTNVLRKEDDLIITPHTYDMCVAFLRQMIRSPLDRRQSGLTLSNGKAIWNCEYWIRAWFSLKNNEPKFKRQKFFEKFIKYGNDLYRYSNTKQGNIDWMIKVFNYKTNALEKINTDKYGD